MFKNVLSVCSFICRYVVLCCCCFVCLFVFCGWRGFKGLNYVMVYVYATVSQIRVNSINPAVVMTDMGHELWDDPEKNEKILSRIPLGRFIGKCRFNFIALV